MATSAGVAMSEPTREEMIAVLQQVAPSLREKYQAMPDDELLPLFEVAVNGISRNWAHAKA